MEKAVFLSAPRALGDQIICNGLYREIASKYSTVFLPVRSTMHFNVSNMLMDLKNIEYVVFPDRVTRYATYASHSAFKLFGADVLKIGFAGRDFPSGTGIRWDENYYTQASIDFSKRWDSFFAPRNEDQENLLFELLGCNKGDFIFVHEDQKRNYTINREHLPAGVRIISPNQDQKKFTIFDYRKIIEYASEIHCIESSFAALIESMPLNVPKFAYRYARPEATKDQWHEYTYRSKWSIFRDYDQKKT